MSISSQLIWTVSQVFTGIKFLKMMSKPLWVGENNEMKQKAILSGINSTGNFYIWLNVNIRYVAL